PVSLLWVVGITNAFNLLDNMDGLSVGTATIGCAYFFVLAVLEPTKQYVVASMAVALGGACLGFLYYNFNRARIFMGDAGSLVLAGIRRPGASFPSGRALVSLVVARDSVAG